MRRSSFGSGLEAVEASLSRVSRVSVYGRVSRVSVYAWGLKDSFIELKERPLVFSLHVPVYTGTYKVYIIDV